MCREWGWHALPSVLAYQCSWGSGCETLDFALPLSPVGILFSTYLQGISGPAEETASLGNFPKAQVAQLRPRPAEPSTVSSVSEARMCRAFGALETPGTGPGSRSCLDMHSVGLFPKSFHGGLMSCSGNTAKDGVKLDFH